MTTETYKDTKILVTQHKDGSHTIEVPDLRMEWEATNLGVAMAMIKGLIDKFNEK